MSRCSCPVFLSGNGSDGKEAITSLHAQHTSTNKLHNFPHAMTLCKQPMLHMRSSNHKTCISGTQASKPVTSTCQMYTQPNNASTSSRPLASKPLNPQRHSSFVCVKASHRHRKVSAATTPNPFTACHQPTIKANQANTNPWPLLAGGLCAFHRSVYMLTAPAAARLLVVTPGVPSPDWLLISVSVTLPDGSSTFSFLPPLPPPQPKPASLLVTPAAPACSCLLTSVQHSGWQVVVGQHTKKERGQQRHKGN